MLTRTTRLDPPADSIALLIGAEADRERRRSTHLSANPHEQVHKRLPHLFSKHSPEIEGSDVDEGDAVDEEEPSPGIFGRVNNYSRLLHRHMRHQLGSPTGGTKPAYAKTMHAHTLNQLNHYRRLSKSETSSPHLETKQAMLPSRLYDELAKLGSDEVPHGPANTPQDCRRHSDVQGIDFRKAKRRSVTEPTVVGRDFAAAKGASFAA